MCSELRLPKNENESRWTKLVKYLTPPVAACADGGLPSLRITYQDPEGVSRTWESAERQTRPAGSDIDGVGILAVLQKDDGVPPTGVARLLDLGGV